MQSRPAPDQRAERQLVAVVAADIAGYSRLMGADEEGTLARLKACRRDLIDPGVARHRGRMVKTTGDGLLIEFSSPVEAVRWAVETQQGMIERNADLPEDRRILFRIGINLGDVIIEDRRPFEAIEIRGGSGHCSAPFLPLTASAAGLKRPSLSWWVILRPRYRGRHANDMAV